MPPAPAPRKHWLCRLGLHSLKIGRVAHPYRHSIAIETMWCRRCGYMPKPPDLGLEVDNDAPPPYPWREWNDAGEIVYPAPESRLPGPPTAESVSARSSQP